MNINSISLAPHAADGAAENQDRRKWVKWLKDIEREAEKGHVTDVDQNNFCTYNEKDRELERYPEDFADGEEPTWWVMGSSKTEPPQKTERQRRSFWAWTANCWRVIPTAGSIEWMDVCRRSQQDSIFRMNSGGDDDRWEIADVTAGYETYTSFEGGVALGGATVSVKFNINANTGYPIIQTVFGPCLAKGRMQHIGSVC